MQPQPQAHRPPVRLAQLAVVMYEHMAQQTAEERRADPVATAAGGQVQTQTLPLPPAPLSLPATRSRTTEQPCSATGTMAPPHSSSRQPVGGRWQGSGQSAASSTGPMTRRPAAAAAACPCPCPFPRPTGSDSDAEADIHIHAADQMRGSRLFQRDGAAATHAPPQLQPALSAQQTQTADLSVTVRSAMASGRRGHAYELGDSRAGGELSHLQVGHQLRHAAPPSSRLGPRAAAAPSARQQPQLPLQTPLSHAVTRGRQQALTALAPPAQAAIKQTGRPSGHQENDDQPLSFLPLADPAAARPQPHRSADHNSRPSLQQRINNIVSCAAGHQKEIARSQASLQSLAQVRSPHGELRTGAASAQPLVWIS